MTQAQKIQLALGWIEAFHVSENVSAISLQGKRPTIHFGEFDDFRRMFGGVPAQARHFANSITWVVTQDGIDFAALQHCERSEAPLETTVPILSATPPESIAQTAPTSV